MKKAKVAINGLGRIGKHAVRILLSRFWNDMELVAINAPGMDTETAAYLINYDSVYGYFDEFDVIGKDDFLYIKHLETEQSIRTRVFATFQAQELPWKELGVDLVIDCSGANKDYDAAYTHIASGAKKMLLSAPIQDPDIQTIVLGANEETLDHEKSIVSNASCTTNCVASTLAIVAKHVAINYVSGVTVHAYTQSQALLDKEARKSLRDGRAAALNIIPSTTGAAKAVEQVLPQLQGKLDLISMRVPVPSGSVVYLDITVDKNMTSEEVNGWFEKSNNESQSGIVYFSQEELVSSDIIGTPYSSIIDGASTATKENHIRLVAWYDNEWGYTNRLVEMAHNLAKHTKN